VELVILIVALIATGIIGAGAIGPVKIPKALRPWQRWALVILGLTVAAGSAWKWQMDEAGKDFRVTSATLVPVNRVAGPCPADQIFEANVTTRGGAGAVKVRLYTQGGYSGPQQIVRVERSGTTSVDLRVRVDRPPTGASTAQDVARLRVLEPSRLEAPPAPFQVECR
jgi:hypothetical protein